MLISCNSCRAKYLVNSADLKPDGRTVQCVNCGNQWYQESSVEENLEFLSSVTSLADKDTNNKREKSNKQVANLPSTFVHEPKVSILNSILILLLVLSVFMIFVFSRKLEMNTLVLIQFYLNEFYFNLKLIINDVATIIHKIIN